MNFHFTGGLEHHPSGFGAWEIQISDKGVFRATHRLWGIHTRHGPFQLSEEEVLLLAENILAANLPALTSSQRPGLPDEIAYRFSLRSSTGKLGVWFWAGDTSKLPHILKLLKTLEGLVEKYTGQTAHFA